MVFDIDDSSPNNPLDIKRPQDLGFSSWVDMLIDVNDQMSCEHLNTLTASQLFEVLRLSILQISAFLVSDIIKNPMKGGNT